MATAIKPDSDFDHFSQAAPEYVEVVLWRRVFLVLGTLVVALLLAGWLMFHWLSGSDTTPVQPNLLAPPGAIPTPAATEPVSTSASDSTTATTESPGATKDAAVSNQASPQTAAPGTVAKTPAAPTTATPNTPAAPAPSNTSTTASTSADTPAKENTKTETASAPITDRYKVQTEILMPAVKRCVLTQHMRRREPATVLTNTSDLTGLQKFSLYQFVEVQGQAGSTLHYIWKRNGKVMAKVRVQVRGDKWRSYSSKNFNPRLLGNWEVDVVDNKNRLMARSRFYLGS